MTTEYLGRWDDFSWVNSSHFRLAAMAVQAREEDIKRKRQVTRAVTLATNAGLLPYGKKIERGLVELTDEQLHLLHPVLSRQPVALLNLILNYLDENRAQITKEADASGEV